MFKSFYSLNIGLILVSNTALIAFQHKSSRNLARLCFSEGLL